MRNPSSLLPRILIISSKHDFSTDHIVFHLNERHIPYLRLNRDQFPDFRLVLSPTPPRLSGEGHGLNFEVTNQSLRSVYFRAPSYLRDIYQPKLSPDEQLQRSQWAAFVRALTVFDGAFWMNHPQATYQAEIKPFQLSCARDLGFDVPATVISNSPNYGNRLANDRGELIVKTLDPTLLKTGEREAFIYTNTMQVDELIRSNLASAPVIIQERLFPKVDVRVTVVRDKVFAVTIKKDGRGIDADWRRTEKDKLEYAAVDLPQDIEQKCRNLTKAMRLQFGAIDLAYCNDKYYFLEINPTGEWAWLVDQTPHKIDEEIVMALIEAEERRN